MNRRYAWAPAVVLMGCSSLPEYAAPRGRVVDPADVSRGADLILYRPLSRADFRAAAPPEEAAAHAEKLGALTCAAISTTPGTSYEIRETVRGSDRTFTVKFQRLGFVAQMDRNCSWWNKDGNPNDAAYVLQHEQIHFALAELEARRRNREAEKLLRNWSERTSSFEQAKELVEERLSELVDDAMEELLDVSQDFDEETSAKFSPERQQEWERLVNKELKALERFRSR